MKNSELLQCLIVDDEPPALDVLRTYLAMVPWLQLAGECSNALDAFQFLQRQEVDVLFLDIKMPQLSGVELVRSLKNPPQVIFTTAFREYAVDGFELNAVDYLLKPFSFDRFLRAVDKVSSLRQEGGARPSSAPAASSRHEQGEFLYFRADRKMVKVFLEDIQYVESLKDYVRIVTEEGQVVTKHSITSLEAMLPEGSFQRIHRSFIVSLEKVSSYTNSHVEVGKKELPIGKLYRHEVEKALLLTR
jgi:DNA-binding LytR/AlgR family response regulator